MKWCQGAMVEMSNGILTPTELSVHHPACPSMQEICMIYTLQVGILIFKTRQSAGKHHAPG